jgi:hypothetical protein
MADLRPKTGKWGDWRDRLTKDEEDFVVEYWEMKRAMKVASANYRTIRGRAASRSKFKYRPREATNGA